MYTPPGTLSYIGEVDVGSVDVSLIRYGGDYYEHLSNFNLKNWSSYKEDQSKINWVNIYGVHDIKVIEDIGKQWSIHPLVLEDISHTYQRPKVEKHDSYIFAVMKSLRFNEEQGVIDSEQISLIWSGNWIISFQEKPGDVFEHLRSRISGKIWRGKNLKADYLAYLLMDTVVDNYFLVLDHIDEKIEIIEDTFQTELNQSILQELHIQRKTLMKFRKTVWPLKDFSNQLDHLPPPFLTPETRVFLRDLYDHINRVFEITDDLRDLATSLIELFISQSGHQLNEVMKTLTIIATMFIPPALIAGIYGMNFSVMPELHWKYGYVFALLMMLSLMGGLFFYIKRKKWI